MFEVGMNGHQTITKSSRQANKPLISNRFDHHVTALINNFRLLLRLLCFGQPSRNPLKPNYQQSTEVYKQTETIQSVEERHSRQIRWFLFRWGKGRGRYLECGVWQPCFSDWTLSPSKMCCGEPLLARWGQTKHAFFAYRTFRKERINYFGDPSTTNPWWEILFRVPTRPAARMAVACVKWARAAGNLCALRTTLRKNIGQVGIWHATEQAVMAARRLGNHIQEYS